MKYSDGKKARLGDKVLIDGQYHGVVVANMDDSEYSKEHPKEKYEYLGSGVMIDTDFGGLVHYQQKDLKSEEVVLDSDE